MIVSELKPWEEILESLGKESKIFIVGCKGCAEACETGGEPQVLQMKKDLEQAGKRVTGYTVVDFLCDKSLVKFSMLAHEDEVKDADSLLVMTCGVGVQATAAVVDKVTHPACNTMSVGGAQGTWPGSERCRECGDCVLDSTGGICPVTACTKSLINGTCGGMKDGKCEVEPDVRDCGWYLIYERLKKLDRLDKMREILPAKAYGKMEPPKHLRSGIKWALEIKEEATKEEIAQ
jgi:ferredoxin